MQKYQLDGVKGAVCTTQKVTIPPFQTLTLKGNAGIKGHCMKVHVLTEPALGPQLPAAVVPIATYGRATSWLIEGTNLPTQHELVSHGSSS